MSFMDEYNALKKKRKQEETESSKKSSVTSVMDEYNKLKAQRTEQDTDIRSGMLFSSSAIAPTVGKPQENNQEKRTWFQKGAFEDGYDFGDVMRTYYATRGDIGENVGKAVVDATENLIDTGAHVVGTVGGWFSDDFRENTRKFIAKDLLQSEKSGKWVAGVLSGGVSALEAGLGGGTDNSVLGAKSDGLVQSAAHLVGSAALQYVGVPMSVTMGVNSFGSEIESAFQQDATWGEGTVSAVITTAVELLTEKISGGIKFGGGTLDDLVTKPLIDKISNKVVRTLAKFGIDTVGEGAEEVVSQFFSTLGQQLTYEREETWKELLKDEDKLNAYLAQVWYSLFGEQAREGYREAFTSGMALGGGMSTINVGKAHINGVDYVSGMTANEEAVVNKMTEDRIAELEKDGKKLKVSEKNEIKEQLKGDLAKGYIPTDTIEEVLGGETYKTYKDTVDSEDALQKEFEELGKKQNATLAEQARYSELSQQIKELQDNNHHRRNYFKSKLSQEVSDLVANDRLSESYNEKARRSQAYQADLSGYDTKQQAVIQKAIDSGILNNTRRTHEFVDMVAKISADKGVLFDFTDNARLKDSGFAVDGKFVNGYVTKDGVTVNIDSAKSLNSVVGHEITHVLEGTEVYDALKQTLFDYAKSKGDYQGRYDSLAELYKNVKDADVEAELAADLVGDYLFTDTDFINNLSTKHRNVFQKIYDEIMYLYKIAAAGSKEARELEKVKKAFEKAYKEGGKVQKNTANDGVNYSIERTKSMSWAEQINGALYDGKNIRRNDTLVVGNPGDTSVANEISDKPLAIPQSVLTKASSSKDISHSIKRGKLAKLDEGIKNAPITIVNPDRNAVVYVTNIKQGGLPIVAAFDMDATFDGDEVHKATSIHLQVDTQSMLENLPESATVYVQKNELDPVGATNNLRGLAAKIKFINGNISQKDPDVKVEFSLSDSDGNQLSKEQQEYFKDSKMRDENGSLKVMYHGTPNGDFTVFRDGTYFTDNKEYADRYQNPSASSISSGKAATAPKTFEVYLDIKKPFDINDAEARNIYINDYIKGGNAIGINPYLSDAEYDKIKTIDWTEGEDLRDFLIENGYDYDGLVLDEGADGGYGDEVKSRGTSYVVFNPEQVKNTDNLKPTADPDIRYSLSTEVDKSYQDAVSRGDMETAQRIVAEVAKTAMPDSKLRTPDGNLRIVYHGTNTGDFTVFNPDYIGMSSGDDGFFGMGFYFAYSKGEASYYGASRVIPAYLDLKNPFDFEKELQTYKGKKASGGYAPDAVALMNFADKFPEIAKNVAIGVVEKGSDTGKQISLLEFSKAFKDVINNKTFEYNEVSNEFGEKETVVTTDPETIEYEYGGEKHSYIDYGFQKRFWGTPNELDVAYEYLANSVFEYVDMIPRTRLILDNNREFTAALKKMGHDGAIQSEHGDEAVVFDPAQIKSAEPVTYDDNGNVIPLSDRFNTKSDDIRYSLSEQENAYQYNLANGDLEIAEMNVEEYANLAMPDSKIRGKDGRLIPVYHGTKEMFYEFDTSVNGAKNGTAEGFGIYLSDNQEVTEAYGDRQIKMFANITKPATSFEKTISQNTLVKLIKDTCEKEANKMVADGEHDNVKDAIKDTWVSNYVYTYGMSMDQAYREVAQLFLKQNSSDMDIVQEVMFGMAIRNYDQAMDFYRNSLTPVTGIDGFITKWDNSGKTSNIYLAFDSSQLKSADAVTKDDNGNIIPLSERFNQDKKDIRYSLSEIGEQPKRHGNYNVSGKDIRLDKGIAPVKEILTTKTETVAPVAEVTDMFPDTPVQDIEGLMAEAKDIMGAMEAYEAVGDTASVEQLMPEYEAVMEKIGQIEEEDRQRVDSLTEGDIPPEMDAPYYGDDQSAQVEDPFESRDWDDVSKRNVKAYMYENPEVKPFFQAEALNLLGELNSTTRGERWYNDELYYESGGEAGFGGVKRHTSASMEELLDSWGMSYADIEKGLNAIIEDHGAENIAAAKKLEFMLNDRLLNGYKDFYTNGHVPPNQDYINLLTEKQITEYSKEAFDTFMANADQYAPPVDDDIAPVQNAAPTETVNAERRNVQEGQQAMWEGVGGEPKRQTRKELHGSIIDNIKSRFSEKGFDLDSVLKGAKNLSTFATVDNTPQRVMEKALGYKEGQILSDITVNQVAQNETEGTKWLNSFTDRKSGLLAQLSKQYNIKPGSKQSAAAQMYAEGFYVNENNEIIKYGDAELAKDFPDFNVQANIKGLARDPRIRQIYDDTLAMINESRTRNAYPEIPRLDNYFLHFRAMDDTFSRLGLPFNPNDIRAKDLPTDLNGVTADLKPGQPYFASAMHRKGMRTSFDLLGGLERYLTSAKNQIYHIDDIQTLRALRNYIADTYGQANGLEGLDALSEEEAQERIEKVYSSHLSTFAKFLNEEANVLAGKTALIDRGLEGILGRRGMTFLDTVNKQVGSNMVGFNISSSLTNFLPVAQTFAKTNKADFVKAFGQTVGNKIGSVFGNTDGFTENSPVVIRRKGADRFYRTPFQKVGDAGYVFMSAVDDISTELIARTKYNELIRKGMDSQQAHYETDKWVSRLMGDRSLGQMPQLYNSKMLGLITKFQLEVRNQLDSQFYDTIQEAKVSNEHIQNGLARNAKTAAKVTSTFVQLAVAQHLFGKAFESVAGYNPAFDIIEVIMTAFGFDDEEESEDTVLDNVEQGFLAMLEDLPYTSTFTGGRIPISSALPIKELVTGKDDYGTDKSRLETLGEVAPYYVLPGGYGQIKKTVQGLKMFSDEHPVTGSYTDKGDLRFPVDDNLVNRVQAGVFGQYASKNARDYFDNNLAPLNEKQVQEYSALGLSYDEYWAYRDDISAISDRAKSDGSSDEDVVKSKYISSIDSELSDIQKEKERILNDANMTAEKKEEKVSELENQFADLVKERYNSYNHVSLDGDYAKIGSYYYQWYTPEDGDPYWRKLTDSQVTKYTLTKNAGNAHYVTNGSVHYRRNEDGEWVKISDKQLARQKEVTNALGITPDEYWSKTDISFLPMPEGEYEYAFDHPDNYAVAKAVGGYDAYKSYSKELYDIKADKDKNGKSISGSRKEKVLDYINNLDADYGEKIILFKSEYPSDDTYNYEIIDYLNSRDDISYSEMETILKELGFNVSSDGNITWD